MDVACKPAQWEIASPLPLLTELCSAAASQPLLTSSAGKP